MGFEDLAYVHAAGHAERIEKNINRLAVCQMRHILFGQDFGDNALITVSAGHLVAHGNLPLGGHVNLDHLLHAAGQFVSAFERVQLAILVIDQEEHSFAESVIDLVRIFNLVGGTDFQIGNLESTGSFGDRLILPIQTQMLNFFLFQHFGQFGRHRPELICDHVR